MEDVYIRRLKDGDSSALEPLMRLHQDMVFTVALRMVKDRSVAEEVTQDVFIKVFRKIDSYEQRSKFTTWLYTIAYRTCLNYLQKKDVTVAQSRLSDAERRQGEVDDSRRVATPHKKREDQEAIWQAIDTLEPLQGVTISLFYLQMFSVKEISDIMEIPENTVKTHLHRGRKELRKVLLAQYREEELV